MNNACDRAFDGVMAKVNDEGWMTQVSKHLSPNTVDSLYCVCANQVKGG